MIDSKVVPHSISLVQFWALTLLYQMLRATFCLLKYKVIGGYKLPCDFAEPAKSHECHAFLSIISIPDGKGS
jgi:hypothetical protein